MKARQGDDLYGIRWWLFEPVGAFAFLIVACEALMVRLEELNYACWSWWFELVQNGGSD